MLDAVLKLYVEEDRSREELLAEGFDPEVVERTLALVDRAEYKRRQAPPGPKLHPKAFGRDRRTPITNRWQGLDAAALTEQRRRAERVDARQPGGLDVGVRGEAAGEL